MAYYLELVLLPNKYKEFQSDKLFEFHSSCLSGQEYILIGILQKVKSELELGIGLVLHGGGKEVLVQKK